jgi:hypothetical protein
VQTKRRNLGRWLIGLTIVSIAVVLTLAFHKGRDVVMMNSKSSDGKSASIVGYKDGLYEAYSADLILYAPDGKIAQRTNLIQGRDAMEDIPIEFLSLEFKDEVVHLKAAGNHYHGTNKFKFPN